MDANLDLLPSEDTIKEATEYKQIVESLRYLLLTHPDISFAVNKLVQFMYAPKPLHWNLMKRVPRYLSGTQSIGLRLKSHRVFSMFTVTLSIDVIKLDFWYT